MPDVRISEAVFQRLQSHAEPFVDSPETVIQRLLDHWDTTHKSDAKGSLAEVAARRATVDADRFNPTNPPDLTHTKLTSAVVDGRPAATWNELVDAAHRGAMERVRSFEKLRAATQSHIAKGRKSDSGFHYLEDIDVSLQGIDSDYAWRNAMHLARAFDMPIRVEFEWRHKPTAAHPGKRGLLEWTPKR